MSDNSLTMKETGKNILHEKSAMNHLTVCEFEDFFKQNIRRIYNLAYHMVGNAQEAEELVQEIFLQAYKSMSGYRGMSSLSSWLYGVAVNVANNHIRKNRRNPQADNIDEVEEKGGLDHGQGKVESIFFKKEKLGQIRQALLGIPHQYRAVFFLNVVEGYSHKEIGRMIGVSAGTSRIRLFRAVHMLRKELKDPETWSGD